jgi:hypothetical protein
MAIDGLALPLDANAVPTELGEREPTVRLTAGDSN